MSNRMYLLIALAQKVFVLLEIIFILFPQNLLGCPDIFWYSYLVILGF